MDYYKKAEKASFIYRQILKIAKENDASEILRELDEYSIDLKNFENYSQCPEEYLLAEGDIAHDPLYPSRRKWLNRKGFKVNRNGIVSYTK